MPVTSDQSIGDIAAGVANAGRIFEIFGIDACCGGDEMLSTAAPRAGLDLGEAIALLNGDWGATRPGEGALRWTLAPLSELIDEIVNGHHRYTRSRLAYFDHALRLLCSGHARTQAQLLKLRSTVDRLIEILVPHMRYEEQVIFPYMRCLERLIDPDEHKSSGATPQDSLRLQAMSHDHNDDITLVDELRRASNDYSAPAGACENERKLYRELAEFDLDLRHHIHLENDVLFRRAAEMEWITQARA
jgi:regulator of cell morphogenesis and NO signaling